VNAVRSGGSSLASECRCSRAVWARRARSAPRHHPLELGTVSNPWRFAGEYRDAESRYYKIGLRYYDPALGRWTQKDPVVGFEDPRRANRYIYAGQDPVNMTDPSGADFLTDAWDYVVRPVWDNLVRPDAYGGRVERGADCIASTIGDLSESVGGSYRPPYAPCNAWYVWMGDDL